MVLMVKDVGVPGLQEREAKYRAGQGAPSESRAISKVGREHGKQDGMESVEGNGEEIEPC